MWTADQQEAEREEVVEGEVVKRRSSPAQPDPNRVVGGGAALQRDPLRPPPGRSSLRVEILMNSQTTK